MVEGLALAPHIVAWRQLVCLPIWLSGLPVVLPWRKRSLLWLLHAVRSLHVLRLRCALALERLIGQLLARRWHSLLWRTQLLMLLLLLLMLLLLLVILLLLLLSIALWRRACRFLVVSGVVAAFMMLRIAIWPRLLLAAMTAIAGLHRRLLLRVGSARRLVCGSLIVRH